MATSRAVSWTFFPSTLGRRRGRELPRPPTRSVRGGRSGSNGEGSMTLRLTLWRWHGSWRLGDALTAPRRTRTAELTELVERTMAQALRLRWALVHTLAASRA